MEHKKIINFYNIKGVLKFALNWCNIVGMYHMFQSINFVFDGCQTKPLVYECCLSRSHYFKEGMSYSYITKAFCTRICSQKIKITQKICNLGLTSIRKSFNFNNVTRSFV